MLGFLFSLRLTRFERATSTSAGSLNISKVPKNTQCNSAYKSIIRYYNELLKLILLTVIELD